MPLLCSEQFAPFLLPELESAGEGGGDADAAYDAYCARVEGTAEWGGHAELVALAGHLQQRIDVYAAGMPVQVVGEEHGPERRLKVCYLRHAFGLGDHYNSTQPHTVDDEGDAAEGDKPLGEVATEGE